MSTPDIGAYIVLHYNIDKCANEIAADLTRMTGARVTRNAVTGRAWRNGLSRRKPEATTALTHP